MLKRKSVGTRQDLGKEDPLYCWVGHAAQVPADKIPRKSKLLDGRLHGTRGRGRLQLRWEDAVTRDSRDRLKIRN